jgi:hypothetical protein
MKTRLLVLLFCLSSSAGAQEVYEFYNGVRALGMGGAGVATVNDETALLINPAGLGKLRDYFITVADPEGEVGTETEQIAGMDVLDMSDPQKALEKTNLKPGKHLHTRGQIFPSIVVPNFGVGILGKSQVDASNDGTLMKYDYTNDYAIVFGFNFRLWNGIIKLGATTRIINRTEIHEDTIDVNSTGNTIDTLGKEGMGVAADSGIILTAPIRFLPSIAAVYRDMGRTSYTFKDGMLHDTLLRPDSTPEKIDVAMSISPILGKKLRSTWTVEYRDVKTASDEQDSMKRIHAGAEFNIADALFIRGGMHQRYWTAGMELSMFNYQFQAASYGEEIGTYPIYKEDRRYVVKFAFRF